MAIKTGKRNFKKIAALAAAAVMSAQFCTNVFAAEKQAEECTDPKVRITIDGQSSFYYTKDKTVGELLKEKNININDYKTEAKVEDIITDGMQIKLQSPVTVKVNVNSGKEVFDYTTKVETIGQLMVELKEKNNVTYKVTDGHSSSEKLENNAVVYLNAVKEEIYVEKTEIPFNVIEKKTDTLFEGETKVEQEGVAGVKEETMKNVYLDEELIDNFCIERKVAKEPVNKVVLVGTKKKEAPKPQTNTNTSVVTNTAAANLKGVNGKIGNYEYTNVVTMNATAYCPCASCNGSWAGHPSAIGLKVEKGVVAVDPSFIPLGTKLYVEGYGYCIAGDTGGAIKGNRIDLCYNSHSEALSSGWGHTNTKVYILK